MSLARTLLLAVFALALAAPASAQIFGGRRQDDAIATLQQQVAAISARLDGAPSQPGLAPQLEITRGELERARSRIDDLEQSLRTLNGTVETLSTDLLQSRSARDALTEQNRELLERLTRLETTQQAMQRSLASAESAPPPRPAEVADAADDTPPEPRPASSAPATADEAWSAARALVAVGDYAEAGDAFEAFATAHPRDPRLQEASYQLAETRYMREDWAGAAAAYAGALRGWPRAVWAAESTLKLAQTLGRLERATQGCQSLAEFRRRYATTASVRGRARADAIGRELGCTG